MKYAVYGTLRKNQGNYNWALKNREGVTHLETKTIQGFDMYAVSSGFPGVIRGNGSIVVDIFEVNNSSVESSLDSLEGWNPDFPEESMYLKEQLKDGTFIYIWNEDVYGIPKVENGDWVNYINSKFYV